MATRVGLLLSAVLAAAAFAVPAADADLLPGTLSGGCPTSGTQVFAPWGDSAYYYLAPNGGLESGSTGWSLSGGAKIMGGNEPFLRNGSHSLFLPSGSSVISPAVCIGTLDLYVRMFGMDVGGTDGGLRVQVVWYGLLNQVLGITDVATYAAGGGWSPTGKLNTAGGFGVPLLPILGSTSARVLITPVGAGSRWQIDDLYVDPYVSRIG